MSERRAGLVVGSWVWALVPLLLGIPAPFVFAIAAGRRRSRALTAEAAAYAVVLVVGLLLNSGPEGSTTGDIGTGLLLAMAAAATIHALVIRSDVWGLSDAHPLDDRAQRKAAKRVIARDPQEAVYLHIGRTDLPAGNRYPDGGLVDVNNVPAAALAAATGIDVATADRIVSTRASVGGFASLDDLGSTLGLAPQLFDACAERLVFLPALGGRGAGADAPAPA